MFRIFVTILGGKLKSDQIGIQEMMTNIRDAEEILSRRRIERVSDLNLGDLSIFLEVFTFFISTIFDSYRSLIKIVLILFS